MARALSSKRSIISIHKVGGALGHGFRHFSLLTIPADDALLLCFSKTSVAEVCKRRRIFCYSFPTTVTETYIIQYCTVLHIFCTMMDSIAQSWITVVKSSSVMYVVQFKTVCTCTGRLVGNCTYLAGITSNGPARAEKAKPDVVEPNKKISFSMGNGQDSQSHHVGLYYCLYQAT